MRFLCSLLLACSVVAWCESSYSETPPPAQGSFYVNGVVYQYATGTDSAVVAAAHSVINHKFVAVKLRVYNVGGQSVTVKPEDIQVEDVLAGHGLTTLSGAALARRMRRPYNWARLGVNPVAGEPAETASTSDLVNPQMLEMMHAMAARVNGSRPLMLPGNQTMLYTDTPGALPSQESASGHANCDTVCRLRNREAASPDVLSQLQRQNSPDYVEQAAFLANTITPRSDADGILFLSMPKLAHGVPLATNGKKAGILRVTVPVGEEKFQFMLTVE